MAATRRTPRGALAAIVLVPAIAFAAVATWAVGDGGPEAPLADVPLPATALTAETPVLSLRRAPETLSQTWSLAGLRASLVSVTERISDPSCFVVEAGGETVSSVRPEQPVVPASNMKLLTAGVLLDLVGDEFRFVTRVVGEMDADGVVDGDLVLVGGGDPMLATAWYPESFSATRYSQQPATSLEELADAVVSAGVRMITGDIVGDESRYDSEYYRPGWDADLRIASAGPYGALLVDDARREEGGVADVPSLGAAQVFRTLLIERGVDVDGVAIIGTAPAEAMEIASIASAPLRDLVEHLLHTSDNNAAEMMLKEIAVATGRPGTSDDGIAALVEHLARRNVSVTGLAPTDGSGLDITSLATCSAMVDTLRVQGADSTLVEAMPLLGVDGTLAGVLEDHPLAGKVYAKTGSLGQSAERIDVKALSGVYSSGDAPPVVFSLLLNGGTVREEATYLPIWRDLADALTTYPSGPAPDQIAPSTSDQS
jgi:serine-type D-Ala-D-Ala carboxypeptidase/endopeptidase (penicillin-binding protein 4)